MISAFDLEHALRIFSTRIQTRMDDVEAKVTQQHAADHEAASREIADARSELREASQQLSSLAAAVSNANFATERLDAAFADIQADNEQACIHATSSCLELDVRLRAALADLYHELDDKQLAATTATAQQLQISTQDLTSRVDNLSADVARDVQAVAAASLAQADDRLLALIAFLAKVPAAGSGPNSPSAAAATLPSLSPELRERAAQLPKLVTATEVAAHHRRLSEQGAHLRELTLATESLGGSVSDAAAAADRAESAANAASSRAGHALAVAEEVRNDVDATVIAAVEPLEAKFTRMRDALARQDAVCTRQADQIRVLQDEVAALRGEMQAASSAATRAANRADAAHSSISELRSDVSTASLGVDAAIERLRTELSGGIKSTSGALGALRKEVEEMHTTLAANADKSDKVATSFWADVESAVSAVQSKFEASLASIQTTTDSHMDSLRAEIAAAVTSVGRLEAQASDASEERTKQRAGLKDVREAVAATIGSTSSFMSVLEEAVSRAEDKAERAMRAASGLEHGLPPPPKSLAIGDKSIRSPDGLPVDENTTPSPLVTAAAPKMPPSHSPSPESSVRSMASEADFQHLGSESNPVSSPSAHPGIDLVALGLGASSGRYLRGISLGPLQGATQMTAPAATPSDDFHFYESPSEISPHFAM
jgi:chromosome segregation ATPase